MSQSTRPVLLFAESDVERRDDVLAVLVSRYGADYRVIGATTVDEVVTRCEQLRDSGARLALAIIGWSVATDDGFAVFAKVRERCPEARCLAVGGWGEARDPGELLAAYARGDIDHMVPYPEVRPDEDFHEALTELLASHARQHGPRFELVRLVGDRWDPRSHQLREIMSRNLVPFGFYAADGEQGARMLAAAGLDASDLPVLLLPDGQVLVDPSPAMLVQALGGGDPLHETSFDVVVVGGGPAGLAAAVYASSEGLRTLVVEAEAVGGQAGTTSMIRNYLGFPRGISGRELALRAVQQARRFAVRFQMLTRVETIEPGDRQHTVQLPDGVRVSCGAVIVATGVVYRRLEVPAVERLSGAGVYYGAALSEASGLTGRPVFVVGGGNSAGQAAVHLARYAAQVTLLIRGGSLAASMSEYLVRELEEIPNIDLRFHTEVVDAHGDRRLERLTLRDRRTDVTSTVEAAALFVLIGGRPRTEWLDAAIDRDDTGYVLTGMELPEAQAGQRLPFETSVLGVFAVGDVRHGSVKRVASAAGEGSVCVSDIHQHLSGERPRRR